MNVPKPMKIEGTQFLAQLPAGYDNRTEIVVLPDGDIMAIHPDKPPLKTRPNGTIETVEIHTK